MFNFFAGSIELENVSGNILFLLFQLPVKIQHPIEKYEWFPKWNIGEWLLPALMIIDHFSWSSWTSFALRKLLLETTDNLRRPKSERKAMSFKLNIQSFWKCMANPSSMRETLTFERTDLFSKSGSTSERAF